MINLVPTPHELIAVPLDFKSAIMYSSKSFEAVIFRSWYPASSSPFLTSLERYSKSPESIRIPAGLYPFAVKLSNTLIAFGRPLFKTLYVSINNKQLSGYMSA